MDKIDELLSRGVENIYPSKDALEKVLRSGKKLRLYQGFDPSGIQLHIGHMTGLMKLRQWQELGHEVIFLIGDGTGQAGDPSGKTRAREKYLTNQELRENAKDYVLQAGKVVSFSEPNPVKILYNGDWLNKLNLVDILNIAGHFSPQQLEERDMFVERKKRGESINMREFLYPLLQGYDSVAMKVDLELGGEDQTFNMLCGRKLVKEILGKEKYVMTTPLLTDNNDRKIGKTEGNVIALNAEPSNFYAMIMSLGDDVIAKCFEFLTQISMTEIKSIENKLAAGENPMVLKKRLAFELTKFLNNEKAAVKAQDEFEKVVQKGESPENILEVKVSDAVSISDLVTAGAFKSKSEAKRLLDQGAIEQNGNKISSLDILKSGDIVKIGKRSYYKLVK